MLNKILQQNKELLEKNVDYDEAEIGCNWSKEDVLKHLTTSTIAILKRVVDKIDENLKLSENSIDKLEEVDERARMTNLLNENMVFGYQQALQDLKSFIEAEIAEMEGKQNNG